LKYTCQPIFNLPGGQQNDWSKVILLTVLLYCICLGGSSNDWQRSACKILKMINELLYPGNPKALFDTSKLKYFPKAFLVAPYPRNTRIIPGQDYTGTLQVHYR
jgi:hypothetical protein